MNRHSRDRRLAWTLGRVVAYMGAEGVGGQITGSLALLADAGHMLSAAAAPTLSPFALRVDRRPPDDRRTFGYQRSEILPALTQGVTRSGPSARYLLEEVRTLARVRFGVHHVTVQLEPPAFTACEEEQ